MIELGARVRDVITGFEGTVVARVEYLSGQVSYGVQPRVSAGCSKLPKVEYISEKRLELAAGVERLKDKILTVLAELEAILETSRTRNTGAVRDALRHIQGVRAALSEREE